MEKSELLFRTIQLDILLQFYVFFMFRSYMNQMSPSYKLCVLYFMLRKVTKNMNYIF
jgi:hypothetical protein